METIREPMFILLLACGSLYMIIGDYREGAILLSSILIIIYITFYQNKKSERALEALKQLSSPRTLVFRDGQLQRIASREIVPDDIVQINEGDRISADAVIIESTELKVDESLLTGESVSVDKFESAENNSNIVYSGTLVTQGKAWVKVIATGKQTQFGQIGSSLENIEKKTTMLQTELKLLIRTLFIASGFISIFIVIFYFYRSGDIYTALLNGLSASMALLPEEFPVVLTIFMALGAWKLSKSNVLTRQPSAIETLGSTTVLCTDKTGTITQNKMVVKAIYFNEEIVIQDQFKSHQKILNELVTTSILATGPDSIDPMELAIHQLGQFENSASEYANCLLKEFTFNQSSLAMARVYSLDDSNNLVACKGAPEAILKLCQITGDNEEIYRQALLNMANRGYRVIGVAKSKLKNKNIPYELSDISFEFMGFLGFEDPIRDEVPQAVRDCKNAGIKVVMITGDYPMTASNIGQQIGLDAQMGIMTGDEIQQLTDEALSEKIQTINIFARVKPEQKLRIVEAFKSRNEIVAMTGDGVNDAPALKSADIGIAMGKKGTDVAREASSLVLLDDNFASIVQAIRQGRRIYDNLQKAMSYILAIHIPIIGLTLLPAILDLNFLLLMPIHIVFLELIIDPICSVAFESEQEEKGIMQRPPRDISEKFFGWRSIAFSFFQGALLLSCIIFVFQYFKNTNISSEQLRTLVFTTMILGNIVLILSTLSKTRNIIDVLKEKNKSLVLILTLAVFILALSLVIPQIRQIFYFDLPEIKHILIALLATTPMLLLLEFIKLYKKQGANLPN